MNGPYDLNNCPFCGSREFPPTVTRTKEGDVVICIECSALGPTRRSITDAIDAWNARAAAQPQVGWMLVPGMATSEMRQIGAGWLDGKPDAVLQQLAGRIWSAMLAATPAAGEGA